MKLTVSQLAQRIGAQLIGDGAGADKLGRTSSDR